MDAMLQEAREKYFFENSQNRRLRRRMAKTLTDDNGKRLWKRGWQRIKYQFPPYNQPMNLGINEFKKAGHSKTEVLEYKQKARATFINSNNNKET